MSPRGAWPTSSPDRAFPRLTEWHRVKRVRLAQREVRRLGSASVLTVENRHVFPVPGATQTPEDLRSACPSHSALLLALSSWRLAPSGAPPARRNATSSSESRICVVSPVSTISALPAIRPVASAWGARRKRTEMLRELTRRKLRVDRLTSVSGRPTRCSELPLLHQRGARERRCVPRHRGREVHGLGLVGGIPPRRLAFADGLGELLERRGHR